MRNNRTLSPEVSGHLYTDQPSARALVAALGGRWHGRYGCACCPAHDDHGPSLSVTERSGKILVHCHAGCAQSAVISALRGRGLWPVPTNHGRGSAPPGARRAVPKLVSSDTVDRALDIWHDASPKIDGTPADRYLRERGLVPRVNVDGSGRWPEALRWTDDAVRLPNRPRQPALIVAVNDPETLLVSGIQRIFFDAGQPALDARGRKVKRALGAIAGNAATLSCEPSADGVWGLAEGVETALAARQLLGVPVWAAISASNMPAVKPPYWARHAVILADHDQAGLDAAARAADALRRKPWILSVRIVRPEVPGWDVADLARASADAR